MTTDGGIFGSGAEGIFGGDALGDAAAPPEPRVLSAQAPSASPRSTLMLAPTYSSAMQRLSPRLAFLPVTGTALAPLNPPAALRPGAFALAPKIGVAMGANGLPQIALEERGGLWFVTDAGATLLDAALTAMKPMYAGVPAVPVGTFAWEAAVLVEFAPSGTPSASQLVQSQLAEGKVTIVEVASLASGSTIRLLTTADPEEIRLRAKSMTPGAAAPYAILHGPSAVIEEATKEPLPKWPWYVGVAAAVGIAGYLIYRESKKPRMAAPNARRATKMSLAQAKTEARASGFLTQDYFALSGDDTYDLRNLMERTRWHQAPSSAAQGRSKLYSFYLALSSGRAKPNARKRTSKKKSRAIRNSREFKSWREARDYAEKQAAASGVAMGIEKPTRFQGWTVKMLPKPENRSGWELRCEVVEPPMKRNVRGSGSRYDWPPRKLRGSKAFTVQLEDRDDDMVMVSVSGPHALQWATYHQTIGGSTWESADGDEFAYTLLTNYPGLVADLRKEGYQLDLSQYTPPEG